MCLFFSINSVSNNLRLHILMYASRGHSLLLFFQYLTAIYTIITPPREDSDKGSLFVLS